LDRFFTDATTGVAFGRSGAATERQRIVIVAVVVAGGRAFVVAAFVETIHMTP